MPQRHLDQLIDPLRLSIPDTSPTRLSRDWCIYCPNGEITKRCIRQLSSYRSALAPERHVGTATRCGKRPAARWEVLQPFRTPGLTTLGVDCRDGSPKNDAFKQTFRQKVAWHRHLARGEAPCLFGRRGRDQTTTRKCMREREWPAGVPAARRRLPSAEERQHGPNQPGMLDPSTGYSRNGIGELMFQQVSIE